MKTFTALLLEAPNYLSPIPNSANAVTLGIRTKFHEKVRQVQLGEFGHPSRSRFDFVGLAFQGGPEVDANGLFYKADICKPKGQNREFLVKSDNRSDSILVLVRTKTRHCCGLTVSDKTIGHAGGVTVVAVGQGSDLKYQPWDDALVILDLHCGIMIEKDGQPAFIVMNSGGNPRNINEELHPKPVIVTIAEFEERSFSHHFAVEPNVAVAADTETASANSQQPQRTQAQAKVPATPQPTSEASVPTPETKVKTREAVTA